MNVAINVCIMQAINSSWKVIFPLPLEITSDPDTEVRPVVVMTLAVGKEADGLGGTEAPGFEEIDVRRPSGAD